MHHDCVARHMEQALDLTDNRAHVQLWRVNKVYDDIAIHHY